MTEAEQSQLRAEVEAPTRPPHIEAIRQIVVQVIRRYDKDGDLWGAAGDAADLIVRLSSDRAEVEGLREALKAADREMTALVRAWVYAPFPAEAQVLAGMSPPTGPIATAVDAIQTIRLAFTNKLDGGDNG